MVYSLPFPPVWVAEEGTVNFIIIVIDTFPV